MQNTTYHLIIIGLAVAFGVALLIAWRSTRDSHATGYDLGYEDGKRGQLDQVNALHEDIALLRSRQRLADAEHQQERERLILDCDARIAVYARRANPLDAADAAALRMIVKTLELAERTWKAMGTIGAASAARLDIGLTGSIAFKVERALIAAGQVEIQPATVTRDADGYWNHPHLPAFDPDDGTTEMRDWLQEQRLQTAYDTFEGWAPDDHPYYQTGNESISDWQPEPPPGEGWFLLSIYETEDNGPVAMFVRRSPADLEAAA